MNAQAKAAPVAAEMPAHGYVIQKAVAGSKRSTSIPGSSIYASINASLMQTVQWKTPCCESA